MQLALGKRVPGDERKRAGWNAPRQQPGKLGNQSWTKPLRSEVVLVETRVPGQRDGRQKLLQGLHLFAVDRPFAVLGLLEPKIIFNSAMDGVVQ